MLFRLERQKPNLVLILGGVAHRAEGRHFGPECQSQQALELTFGIVHTQRQRVISPDGSGPLTVSELEICGFSLVAPYEDGVLDSEDVESLIT